MADVTRWLNASTSSRDEEMFAGLYAELHKIARGNMAGERPEQTLEATGLVHEAWLRLQKSAPEEWRDRKQFYGAAAEAMRRILVEAARRRLAAKRGGGEEAVPLGEDLPGAAFAESRYRSKDQCDRRDAAPLITGSLRLADSVEAFAGTGRVLEACLVSA